MQTTLTTRPVTDEPVYWFAILDRAIASQDWHAAANAQANLKRLGVLVAFDGFSLSAPPVLLQELGGIL